MTGIHSEFNRGIKDVTSGLQSFASGKVEFDLKNREIRSLIIN